MVDKARFCLESRYPTHSRRGSHDERPCFACAPEGRASTNGAQVDVAYRDEDDDADGDAHDSPLWPRAADGSSGLRGKSDSDSEADRAGLRSPGAPQSGSSALTPAELGASPYKLLGPMGSTAYGRVFRARHVAQQRDVALHFFTLDDDGEGTLSRALPLAVAKCAQLSHPNVIALEEHGRDERNGTYFLVTGALEGQSLADLLADVGSLPLPRALDITVQIGRALRAAHKLGIVHGALTPANVRVSSTPQGELVRVVGFGCTTFSPRGPALGDPYQPPEYTRDTATDPRSDVYAIGGLIYRMLTGRAPAPVKGGVAEAPSLLSYSSEPIPRELDELVARCMDSDPNARLSDLVSLMRELREVARSVSLTLPDDRMSSGGPPAAEHVPHDSDSSGSLFGSDTSSRRGAAWIIAGLLLALAAVWLVWEASTRTRPRGTPLQQGAPSAP
jgi:serine/threonine protein kinase